MITEPCGSRVKGIIAQLLPCPFCGSKLIGHSYNKILYSYPPKYMIRFRCKSCHCGTGKSRNPEKLIPLWNGAKR